MVDEPLPGAAIDVGENETVTPDGWPEADSAIALLNPFSADVVIVELPEFPWTTETDPGEAESEKSGLDTVEQEGYLKLPTRVCQWKESPLLA
jgi:hypothetical protein